MSQVQKMKVDRKKQGVEARRNGKPVESVKSKLHRLKKQIINVERVLDLKRKKRVETDRESLHELRLKQNSIDTTQKLLDDAEKRQTEAEGRYMEMEHAVAAKRLQLQQVEKQFEEQRKHVDTARHDRMMLDIQTNMLERHEREVLARSTIAEGKKVLVKTRRKTEEKKLSEIENEKKQVQLELKKLKEGDQKEKKVQKKNSANPKLQEGKD